MTERQILPNSEKQNDMQEYIIFIDNLSRIIKEAYLSLGLKSHLFDWNEYNSSIAKQIGYLSRFVVAMDTGQIGFDGRIRYRSRLYVRSAVWYYAKLLKAEARGQGKTMARRTCDGCENDMTMDWQPITGFSFESGLIGIDCNCYPEFK